MGDTRQCSLCGRQAEAFEHAAYQAEAPQAGRRYLGWLCADCARRHGSHSQFATIMLALDPGVWLVANPETPLEASYRLRGR